MKNNKVKALLITGYGLNCENETAVGFQKCGASPDLIHLCDLVQNPRKLLDYHILVFIGGFSFGDHLGAGTVLANRLKFRLRKELSEFIESGKLILGICNGFQTMARLGLVPALTPSLFEPQVALAPNDKGVFWDDWVTLIGNPNSPCVFTKNLDKIELPIRHGEGKFIAKDKETLEAIEKNNLVALRYAHPEKLNPTDEFPFNPNGSINSIAGICDPTGRIFGLMPHPEAYLSPYNHPNWNAKKIEGILEKQGSGQLLFQNATNFIVSELL